MGVLRSLRLQIDKLKRHTDQQVVANFWRSIENIKRR